MRSPQFREKWRFPRKPYDPFNDLRKCKRCGNTIFSADDMRWTEEVQRGLARCWRCPGKPCNHVDWSEGVQRQGETSAEWIDRTRRISCSACEGFCRGCGLITDADCIRCFGCFFDEAVRLRRCDSFAHRGPRAVPNTWGLQVRVSSEVKHLPQKRWFCMGCYNATGVQSWEEYEEENSPTTTGKAPEIAGFQPVLLANQGFDPLKPLGGRELLWPRTHHFYGVMMLRGVYFPNHRGAPLRTLKVGLIRGDDGTRLQYDIRLITDSLICNLMHSATDGFGAAISYPGHKPNAYYAVHSASGAGLTVKSFDKYREAVDCIMAKPWGDPKMGGIVANFRDGKPWDGES